MCNRVKWQDSWELKSEILLIDHEKLQSSVFSQSRYYIIYQRFLGCGGSRELLPEAAPKNHRRRWTEEEVTTSLYIVAAANVINRGLVQSFSKLHWMGFSFPNAFYGLFLRWTRELNITELGNFPFSTCGYAVWRSNSNQNKAKLYYYSR